MDDRPEEIAVRPMTFLAAAGWTIAVVLFYWLSLSFAESIHPGALADTVTRTTCGALAYAITLYLILRVHEPESSIRRLLSLKPPPLMSIPLALVAGGALAGPIGWLEGVLAARFPSSPAEEEVLERLYGASTYDTTPKRLALVLTMVLVMPTLDELFFRGALFTPLAARVRLGGAALATAVCETLVSTGHPREMLGFFVVALAFASVRAAAGSVVPAILARMAYHAPRFVPLALGREPIAPSRPALVASLVTAVVALGVLVLALRGRARPPSDALPRG